MNEVTNIFICHDCIGEAFLKQEVLKEGNIEQCSFCQKKEETIKLEELSEKVHIVIDNYFYLTNSFPEGIDYTLAREGLWERDGQPVNDLIGDIVGIELTISTEIINCLSDIYDGYGKDGMHEDQPYESEAQYIKKEINTYGITENWSFFKQSISSKSRYFNRVAEDVLEQIFQDMDNLVTSKGDSVIQVIPINDHEPAIYRARVASSNKELKEILSELPNSLGSPPHQHAKSGRMNADGISVFYGALDVETCITEVRAPVGSSVVVGAFFPVRPLLILNLNRLQDLFVTGSFFDPNHIEELSRASFLKQLVVELSSPVLPGNEEQEYLPTQFLAEYLAQIEGLSLDGVMFKSSQVSSEGHNVVLFNNTCGLESYKLSKDTEIKITFGQGNPDDNDRTITIWESLPPEKEQHEDDSRVSLFSHFMDGASDTLDVDDDEDLKEVVLKLDLESVKIHEILGVKYNMTSIDVCRNRSVKREPEF